MEIIVLLTAAILIKQCACQSHQDMERLTGYLFNTSRYDPLIRPLYDQSQALQINVSMAIASIEDEDITTGNILTFSYMRLIWRDEFLVWNPADYGGISKIYAPKGSVWAPDTAQVFVASYDEALYVTEKEVTPTFVLFNGIIVQLAAGFYSTKCKIDTTYFPFDKHKCVLEFYASRYPISELTMLPEGVELIHRVNDNGEWTIEDTVIEVMVDTSYWSIQQLQVTVFVRRRWAFAVIHQCIPVILLVLLNAFSFLIPLESGERLSFSVSTYLALIFLSISLIDGLPRSSLTLSMMSYDLLFINVLNTASVIWSIFTMRLWKLNGEIPHCLKTISQASFPVHCNNERKMHKISKVHVIPVNERMKVGERLSTNGAVESFDEANNELDDPARKDTNVNTTLGDRDVTWEEVTRFLDKVFFVVTLIIVVVLLVSNIVLMLKAF